MKYVHGPDRCCWHQQKDEREDEPDTHPNYWFAFYPRQQEFLRQYATAYVAFGCGTDARLIVVPYAEFEPWLKHMRTTSNDDRMYWHVVIYREGDRYALRGKKGATPIDITPYLLPPEPSSPRQRIENAAE